MKNLVLTLAIFLVQFSAMAQVRIERNGSPDLQLYNMDALNTGITSRLLFKSGTYYTGNIGTIGTASNTARLSFFTQAAADPNALAERMTILNNGYVGIGTNNPTYKFDVQGSGIGITQQSSGGTAQIGFYTSSSEAYLQTHNNIPLYFATNNSSAQMALTTTGRLGIGTTTPGSKLEVKGKTKLVQQPGDDSAVEITGNIKVSGSNPAAFVVTATNANEIIIDHPACNGNPNAIILVTPRFNATSNGNGPIRVEYVTNTSKWRIIPVGIRTLGIWEDAVRKCNGDCWNTTRFVFGEENSFTIDTVYNDPDTFNVLIIAN
jgi:hypothetical protein